MRTSISRKSGQRGFSTIVLIVIVGIVGFLLLAFFTVFPMIYENLRVQNALDQLAQDSEVDVRSKRAIWTALQKRFYVDGVKSIQRENVSITRKDGQTTVLVQYQAKDTFVMNFFIGADYENQVVIDR